MGESVDEDDTEEIEEIESSSIWQAEDSFA